MEIAEAVANGLLAYYCVGFVLGVWWTAQAMRDDDWPAWMGVFGVLMFVFVWPGMLLVLFMDDSDRWKR